MRVDWSSVWNRELTVRGTVNSASCGQVLFGGGPIVV
jgi:hypothetical protein